MSDTIEIIIIWLTISLFIGVLTLLNIQQNKQIQKNINVLQQKQINLTFNN